MDSNNNKNDIFKKIFSDCYERIYGYVLSRVHTYDAASEIANDVFCRLWEQFDHYDLGISPLPLLYTIARNLCTDYLRRQALQNYDVPIAAATAIAEENISDVIEREERILKMMAAIEKLPPQTRKVVELCFLEGKKYKETAFTLGISVNTVKTLLSRAMKVLRSEQNLDKLKS